MVLSHAACSSPKGGTPLALETADFYNYLYSSNGITKILAGRAGVRTSTIYPHSKSIVTTFGLLPLQARPEAGGGHLTSSSPWPKPSTNYFRRTPERHKSTTAYATTAYICRCGKRGWDRTAYAGTANKLFLPFRHMPFRPRGGATERQKNPLSLGTFFCFGELKRCSLPCYYTIGGDL